MSYLKIVNLLCVVSVYCGGFLHGFCFAAEVYVPVPLSMAATDGAYVQAQWAKEVVAFNKKTMVTAYQTSGSRHETWDAAAESLLENWATRFSGLPKILDNAALLALAKTLERLECDDPLVNYCIGKTYETNGQHREKYAAYERAYVLAQSKACPLLRKAFICVRMINAFDGPAKRNEEQQAFLEKVIREYVQYIEESLSQGEYAGMERLGIEHITTNEVKDHKAQKILYDALIALSGRLEQKWVGHCICGWASVKMAWWYRGGGWANTVTDEGWAGFRKYLAQAETEFTRSWELNPKSPVAAAEMITVAMGTKTQLPERAWFDRAVAAQFDYADAYDKYAWSLRPRWSGSHAQMLKFGSECAETKRYDTFVPMRLNVAIQEVFDECVQFKKPEAAKDMFENKELWKAVAEVIEQRMVQPDQRRHEKWYKTCYAILAYKFGELKMASDIATELKGSLDAGLMKHYHLEGVNLIIEEVDPLDDL